MGMLPKLSESDLVRTDFTDSTAWEHAGRPVLTAPIARLRGAALRHGYPLRANASPRGELRAR